MEFMISAFRLTFKRRERESSWAWFSYWFGFYYSIKLSKKKVKEKVKTNLRCIKIVVFIWYIKVLEKRKFHNFGSV